MQIVNHLVSQYNEKDGKTIFNRAENVKEDSKLKPCVLEHTAEFASTLRKSPLNRPLIGCSE